MKFLTEREKQLLNQAFASLRGSIRQNYTKSVTLAGRYEDALTSAEYWDNQLDEVSELQMKIEKLLENKCSGD